MTKTKSVLKRFAKAFVSGGFSSVAVLLASGVTISNLAEAKNTLFVLSIAFISGGIMAIDKLLNWTPEPKA